MRTRWFRSLKLLSAAALGLVAASVFAQGPAPVVTGLPGASGLGYNRITRKLYVSTDDGVAIVDSNTFNVETLIPTSGAGHIAVDTRRNRFFYSEPSGSVTVADGDTGAAIGSYNLPSAASGVGIDLRLGRFSSYNPNDGYIYTLNSETGAYAGALYSGNQNSVGRLAADGTAGLLYAAHGDAPSENFTVIDMTSGLQVGGAFMANSPSCVAVNPNTDRLYVGLGSGNGIDTFSTVDDSSTGFFPTPGNIQEVDLDRRAELLYAIGEDRQAIYRIDAKTGTILDSASATTAAGFQKLAVDGVSGEVYVTDGESLLKWAAPVPAPGYTYRAAWIAECPGADRMQHWIINVHGQVTAWAVLPPSGGITPTRGYVNDVDGVMYEPFPGQNADVFFINNLQQISGSIRTGSFRHALIGDISGNYTEIQPFTNLFSRALGLNDLGQAVGEGRIADQTTRGFAYDPVNGITDLGSFGGNRMEPYEIINSGYIIGHGQLSPNDNYHGAVATSITTLTDIGTFGGSYSHLLGMNELGQAAGASADADQVEHALLWDEFDGIQDLGMIDTWSEANDMNDNGLVVGNGDGGPLLFDFVNGMRYILPFVEVPADMVVDATAALNNDGYLAGNSHRPTGEKTACILIPTPTDTLQAMSIDPADVLGGEGATGKVVLAAPAGPGGVDVDLSSDTPEVTVDPSVHIDEGQYVATFNITTTEVATEQVALISATSGSTSFGATLVVHAPGIASITFAYPSVVGNTHNTATVTLADPAPEGGVDVHMYADNPAIGTDMFVHVNEGETSVDVDVNTIPVLTDQLCTLTAEYQGQVSGQFTVRAPRPVSINSDNQVAPGGSLVTYYVTIDGPAPANYAVTMTTNNPNAPVNSAVSFGEGSTEGGNAFNTLPVNTDQTAIITAHYLDGSASRTLTIQAAQLKSNTLNPGIVFGGQSTIGTVTLTGPAGPSGASIALTRNGNGATLPVTTINIPAGGTTATYTVSTSAVTSTNTVTINAKWKTVTKPATLTIKAVQMQAVQFLNSAGAVITSAKAGTTIRMRITLSGPAPAAGASVNLSSSNSKVLPLPKSATVPGSQSTVIVQNIKLGAVKTNTSVTGSGTYGGLTKSATLTVTP